MILQKEPTNVKDRLAVSVQKEGQVVGHVPRNLAPLLFYFLDRDVNKGFAEVTAVPLNRGAGMGIEVPVIFRLYGPELYVKRLKDMIKRDLDTDCEKVEISVYILCLLRGCVISAGICV